MQRYIVHRLVQAAGTLVVISIIVFFVGRLTGNPLDVLLPEDATPEQYEVMARELGVDKPIVAQYIAWARNALIGDFGVSIRAKTPVTELIAETLGNSARLATVSIVFAVALAVPLGIISAVWKDTGIDTAVKVVAFAGMATPSFWLGILGVMVFSVWLGWLPTSGIGSPLHYLMPGLVLAWSGVAAGGVRLLRSSMLDVLDTEYVKLARIKGVSELRVVLVHALRNAVIPVLTFTSVYFGILIGTAVIVETVFAWPGLGRLAYSAVLWRDFPLIQGIVLVVAAIMMAINLVVDVLYAYIDPRIRY